LAGPSSIFEHVTLIGDAAFQSAEEELDVWNDWNQLDSFEQRELLGVKTQTSLIKWPISPPCSASSKS